MSRPLEHAHQLLPRTLDVLVRADVAHQPQTSHAVRLERVCGLLYRILAACEHRDVSPGLRQALGDRAPDAPVSAGHESPLARQIDPHAHMATTSST
jgi:hypothetical protein